MKKIYSLCGVITCIWSHRTLYNPRVNFPGSATRLLPIGVCYTRIFVFYCWYCSSV